MSIHDGAADVQFYIYFYDLIHFLLNIITAFGYKICTVMCMLFVSVGFTALTWDDTFLSI